MKETQLGPANCICYPVLQDDIQPIQEVLLQSSTPIPRLYIYIIERPVVVLFHIQMKVRNDHIQWKRKGNQEIDNHGTENALTSFPQPTCFLQ
jgi:hypothetical protein